MLCCVAVFGLLIMLLIKSGGKYALREQKVKRTIYDDVEHLNRETNRGQKVKNLKCYYTIPNVKNVAADLQRPSPK